MPILRQNQTSVSCRNEVAAILMHSFKKSNRNFIKLNRTTNWDKTNKLLSCQITLSLVIAAVHTSHVIRPYFYIILLTFYFERYKIIINVHVRLHSTEGEWNMWHVNGTLEHNDRHCTYKVTLRCVRTTIVAVEMQWVLHNLSVRVCSLRYPECNAHAPYFQLWPTIFFHIISQKARFSTKSFWTQNVCFDFL